MSFDLVRLLPTEFGQVWHFGLPDTAALAAVALIGYLFGRRRWVGKQAKLGTQRQYELDRASDIARQLETISHALRQDLTCHHGQLVQFKRRLSDAQQGGDRECWKSFCTEADEVIARTMQVAQHLSLAYKSIRSQCDLLDTFVRERTDPLTGVGNVRALCENIDAQLTLAEQSGTGFSVAVARLDGDPADGAEQHDRTGESRLSKFARLIESCTRDTDFVAHYGHDEFVVVMPHTRLAGASAFGERLRIIVSDRLSASVGCGMAEYEAGDTEQLILARARSALYHARAAGRNRQFVHTGAEICAYRSVEPEQPVESAPPSDNGPAARVVTS